MRFTVPQFIEYEVKIVGPLTFRQFIFVAIAGAIGFFLYFTAPFTVFLLSSIVLGCVAFSLAFLKVGGREITTVIASFLKFNITPKTYLWRKKEAVITILKKGEEKTVIKEEELPLKIAEKSRLKKIKTVIETKTK